MTEKTCEASYPKGRAPIRPERLAAKLAAIRNYEYPETLERITKRPRLVELLWFLQFMSIQPGGLLKFCQDMVQQMPGRFGTRTMRASKPGSLSLDSKLKIYREIPEEFRPYEPALNSEAEHVIGLMINEDPPGSRTTKEDRWFVSKLVGAWTLETFRERCVTCALDALPECLAALCTDKGTALEPQGQYDLWFIDDLIGAIMEMMDSQAARVQKRIAMTEVAKLIFDRLDYALAERVMVRIEGGSRFGKTEALSAWAEMRPGLARLVRVPCDNSMITFFKRIGEALGMNCSYASSLTRLKERIEYVVQHGGLFLVLDEGHFLAPMNFTTTTTPHRLNWVRTEIVDRGLPLAISMTPQAFKGAVDRFVKKTGYDMTQFFGRDFLPCLLPEVLSEADLIAVARIHFPELGENALGYIANEARLSQNYLQTVEAVARRTRDLARKRGDPVKVKDIQTAVCEVLGRNPNGPEQGAQVARFDSDEPASMVTKRGAGRRVKGPLSPIARGVQPVRMGAGGGEALDPCSLRGAGPGRVSTELVSAET
jgi:hypothetical protein